MSHRVFSLTAGVIFGLIALGHLLRVVFALVWTVNGRTIPMWPSWIALLIAGYLAFEGFRLAKKPG